MAYMKDRFQWLWERGASRKTKLLFCPQQLQAESIHNVLQMISTQDIFFCGFGFQNKTIFSPNLYIIFAPVYGQKQILFSNCFSYFVGIVFMKNGLHIALKYNFFRGGWYQTWRTLRIDFSGCGSEDHREKQNYCLAYSYHKRKIFYK